ncbi:MAG TPA: helix-turn-helix transcriptional regulator [Rhizomicrobium sp.]|jgi:DNA-binding CsgD family transcriptional regulator/PAS domain-containing protein
MVGSGQLPELIDMVYDAVIEPLRWRDILARVADAISAEGAALHFQDQVTGKGWGVVSRIDPEAIPLYFGHFATRNPIRRRRNEFLGLGRDPVRWRSGAFHDEHALPKSELMRSEYYGDFLSRFDMHSLLMMGLAVEATRFASINFIRPRRREQFGQSEIDIAAQLQPHLIRAFGLSLKLSDIERRNCGLMEFVDRSPHAVFLAESGGRVRHLNRAAELLIAAKKELVIKAGILSAVAPNHARKLHEAIALAGCCEREKRSGVTLSLSGPSPRKSVSVSVSPLTSERVDAFSSEPLVLVCVSDPSGDVAMPGERLQQLYGLTRAEVKIAQELLLGYEPKRIAERLSLSIHTVRVHLARLLAKTETTRQAELVLLLQRVSGI